MEELLSDGRLDGILGARTAVRLSCVLQALLGRIPVDVLSRYLGAGRSTADTMVATLSDTISELARPIDAIKHQAKTVTVGVSRSDSVPSDGDLWKVFAELKLRREDLLTSHSNLLSAFEPLVMSVKGVTLYRLTGLDSLGRPTGDSRICVERKLGCADAMVSRCDSERPLSGNKWASVKYREIYLGCGQSDNRKILILPVVGEATQGHIALYHLELESGGQREVRLRALRARGKFFDRLQAAVTERNLEWNPALIDRLDNDTLFLLPPERVAEELSHACV